MLPWVIPQTAEHHLSNHRFGFFLVDPRSEGGAEVDVTSEGFHNDQVSNFPTNAAEKSEEKILAYTDGIVNDFSPTVLSDEGLSGNTKV